MATGYTKVKTGLNIQPLATSVSVQGDVDYNSSSNQLEVYTTTAESISTNSNTQTLTNKTINGGGLSGTFTGNTTLSGDITFSGTWPAINLPGPGSSTNYGLQIDMQTSGTPTAAMLQLQNSTGSNAPVAQFRLESSTANCFELHGASGGSSNSLIQKWNLNTFAVNTKNNTLDNGSGSATFVGNVGLTGSTSYLGVGSTGSTSVGITLATTVNGASNSFGIDNNATFGNAVTASAYAFYSTPQLASGTSMSNAFEIYLNGFGGSGSASNRYGVYQASNAINYFNGNTSFGGTLATSNYTLPTGTGSSGYALTWPSSGSQLTWSAVTPSFSGLNSNGIAYANSTSTLSTTAAGTNGQILFGNTSSAPTWLAVGAAGQVLGLSGGFPSWTTTINKTQHNFITSTGTGVTGAVASQITGSSVGTQIPSGSTSSGDTGLFSYGTTIGLVVIGEYNNFHGGLFFISNSGNTITKVTADSIFTTTPGTSSSLNVSVSGGNISVQNFTGASANINMTQYCA